ncbi:MAG: response regulator, partial [Ignavibacteriales bacterium]|nr:response regulator [Ignavibacteriales bacterium]
YLIKIANRTPFTPADKDFFKIVGSLLQSVLDLWNGGNLALQSSFKKIIAEAANELRTPTNSIIGFASLLSDDQLTHSQKEYVGTLRENAQKLLTLINDIVDYSKAEVLAIPFNPIPAQLSMILQEASSSLNEKLANTQVSVSSSSESRIPDGIKLDAGKLRYVLQQFAILLANHTESGKVTISAVMADANRLIIRISNSGILTPVSNIPQIVAGTALVDAKTAKYIPISMLSIPLAKRFLEMMSGTVDVVSSPLTGSTFTIQLPVSTLSTIESKISALPKIDGKNKVLVIEDDYATSKLLSNYLNKWGYEPQIINSGLKALDLLKKERFLAVIMDIVLPDVNGLELLKRIREEEHSKYTPVIVCSVEAEQQKAFLMGAVEYFVKPIRYKDLVEVLTSYKLKKDSNILCVDDDVPTLNLVKGAIESVGFNAIAESHSSRVIELIKDMQLDLAIVDLDMPELNGFELIKQIKSQTKFANLPIIIYTGKENFDDDLKSIDGLFTELLSKRSTKIEDLADTINSMINRYEQPNSPEEVKETTVDVPKILLVEDYKHSQIIVTRLLKKNGFTSVVVVENGAEAVSQARGQHFELILMDMQMPVMNGFEATERIRQIPEYTDTPIIALTAFAMKGDKEKCLEAGATDYIPKPIDSVEFIEKVKHYTSRKH